MNYLKFFKEGYTVILFSNYDPDDVEPLAGKLRDIFVGGTNTGAMQKIRDNQEEKQSCCENKD